MAALESRFNSCKMHTQFGYYVVVMYAMAMHKGIVTGTFNKDMVTPELLQSMLKRELGRRLVLVGNLSYGECLVPGGLQWCEAQFTSKKGTSVRGSKEQAY